MIPLPKIIKPVEAETVTTSNVGLIMLPSSNILVTPDVFKANVRQIVAAALADEAEENRAESAGLELIAEVRATAKRTRMKFRDFVDELYQAANEIPLPDSGTRKLRIEFSQGVHSTMEVLSIYKDEENNCIVVDLEEKGFVKYETVEEETTDGVSQEEPTAADDDEVSGDY